MKIGLKLISVTILTGILAGGACTKKNSAGGSLGAPSGLWEQGKKSYQANCIACHNQDPAKDGSIGPSVAASSLELIERRVVVGDYPDGYKPKRSSRAMVALPHLRGDVEALHKYLSSLTASP